MSDVMPLTERLRHKALAIRTCAPRARSAKIAEDDAVAMEAAAAEIDRLQASLNGAITSAEPEIWLTPTGAKRAAANEAGALRHG